MADLNNTLAELKNGKVQPIYLLIGDNDFLKDSLVENFKKTLLQGDNGDFNYQKYDKVTSLKEIIDAANSIPFFSEKRLLVTKDENIFKPGIFSDNEYKYFMEYLADPNPTTCLIFVSGNSVDKRSKMYKRLCESGEVLDCETPKGIHLLKWINKEFALYNKKPDAGLVNLLAASAKGDLYFLTNEIKKICLYVGNKEVLKLDDVEEVLAKTLDTGIFQVIDYLAERELAKALKGLNDLLELGESPILVNYMLARHYRQMLQYLVYSKKGLSEKELCQKLGIPFFVLGKLGKQVRGFNIEKLAAILDTLYKLDLKLKTTSSDAKRMLELTLINLAQIQDKEKAKSKYN